MKWPKVVFSSVLRGTKQGNIHGGLYLLDLSTREHQLVYSLDNPNISFEGRGGDRGLRGIAFYKNKVITTASNELFIMNKRFKVLDSFKCPYLQSAHELAVRDNKLYVASTSYNSVLEFDLDRGRFTHGFKMLKEGGNPIIFNPNNRSPKIAKETSLHLNNVYVSKNKLYWSGLRTDKVWELTTDGKNKLVATVFDGTHNTRPYKNGWLTNWTWNNKLAWINNTQRWDATVPHGDQVKEEEEGISRSGFARGMCQFGNHIVIGTSPAAISVFKFGKSTWCAHYPISDNISNAIHGLEIWPF